MSASEVRATVRKWAGEVDAAKGTHYVETVNVSTRPTEPVWWTVEFTAEFNTGTFCKPNYTEDGFIRVIVVSLPGRGDIDATNALEAIVPELFKKIDATGHLDFVNYEPINESTAGTADESYRVSCVMNYKFGLN